MDNQMKELLNLLEVRTQERIRLKYVTNAQLRAEDKKEELEGFYPNSRLN